MGFSKSKTMAFPCVSILPLLLLLLVTPLSSSLSPTPTPTPTASEIITKESLNQLCSTPTIYKRFCVAWLTSDPITFALDLNGLLGMVLMKTQYFGYKNLATMKGLARTTTDPTLKIQYGSCITYYELANKSIDEAIKFAFSKAYSSASQEAAKAFLSITTCEADLAGRKNVPSYVPTHNRWFKKMCNIGRVFSDILRS